MPRGFLIRRLDDPPPPPPLMASYDPLPLHSLVERLRFGCLYPPSPPPLDLSFKPPPSVTPPTPAVNATATATPTPGRKRQPPAPPSHRPWKLAKKAVRKLSFDDETTSPVSGTLIRPLADGDGGGGGEGRPTVVRNMVGDIDPCYNVVEVTDQAKAELAKIDNRIGDYVCRLCRELYEDAFGLAQHRCSRIVHIEYRCTECDKLFNCPANLASHRRWHRPRPATAAAATAPGEPCPACGKLFRRRAHLDKHVLQAHAAADRSPLSLAPNITGVSLV